MGETIAEDYIRRVLAKPTVFKDKSTLYPEYVPSELPHRERQMEQLAELFKPFLNKPGDVSLKVVLLGGVGTGKSTTARLFGKVFQKLALERGINVSYIHVNCHRDRTLFEAVSEIARQARSPIPLRGLSPREMMLALLNIIEKSNQYLLIAMDEFDYFARSAGSDAVYFLVRLYDEYPEAKKRLQFMFIMRDSSALAELDSATYSFLMKHIVRFDPYTSIELFDILKYRASLALYEGTVSDEVLMFIANRFGVDKGGSGNARAALECLLLAGEAADSEGSNVITFEHVRKALGEVDDSIVMALEMFPHLDVHKLLLIKATINVLKNSATGYARIGEVEEEYRKLCEIYGERPRKHTQVYEYVMDLKRRGIVETRTSGKGMRGRSTLIEIPVSLEKLEKIVNEYLDKKIANAPRK